MVIKKGTKIRILLKSSWVTRRIEDEEVIYGTSQPPSEAVVAEDFPILSLESYKVSNLKLKYIEDNKKYESGIVHLIIVDDGIFNLKARGKGENIFFKIIE